MVTRIVLGCVALLGLWVSSAAAQDLSLRASVDRATVRENESFSFVLRAQGRFRGEPDLMPLASDFDILEQQRNTSIQMSGGDTSVLTEWSLQLMPTRSGNFTLPPIELAGAFSNPVEIEVLPALQSDAPADIFLEAEVSPSPAYVQAEIIYTVRLFRRVSTGRSTLSAPEVAGGEAIIERLGDDREYQVVRDGRNFIAVERRYVIFPQTAGDLTVQPVTFEARVIMPTGFSSLQRFGTEAMEIEVLAAVPPPAQWPDAAWLPARSLSLAERWSADDEALTAGVPQTRTLILEASGVLDSQLPEIRVPPADGVRQYPDQPELSREVTQQGLQSRRTERYAVIAQEQGARVLPGVEVPWFDVVSGGWQLARIEPRSINVLPSPERSSVEPVAASEALPAPAAASSGSVFWQAASAGLLVAWLATLALWWQSRRLPRTTAKPAPATAPRRAANRRLLSELRAACRANDAPRARTLLLQWGALRLPEKVPASLGALARHLPAELAAAVAELERRLYGPDEEPWDGGRLAAALSEIDGVNGPRDGAAREPLLPLYH